MKHICFFITHKTLGVDHLDATLHSISLQDPSCVFDEFYIYNTHKEELSNEYVQEIFDKYNLKTFFRKVYVFDYFENTHKSLGADIATIRDYCQKHFNHDDRILLLKSDCVLSKNYFSDIMSLSKKILYFLLHLLCVLKKELVMMRYLNMPTEKNLFLQMI